MKVFLFLHHWFRGRDLSRVEVVKALFALPVIRPPKPPINLVLHRSRSDVWGKKKVA